MAAGTQRTASENRARLRDVLRIVRGHGRWIATAVALTLAGSALALVQPLVVKHLIDSAEAGRIIWQAIGLLIVLFVAEAIVEGVARYVLGRTGERIVLDIRRKVIGHLLRLYMPAYDRQRIGDLISRASTDSTALRRVV